MSNEEVKNREENAYEAEGRPATEMEQETAAHRDPESGENAPGVSESDTPDGDEGLLLEQQRRIGELEERLAEMKEQSLRRVAELDNVKKRVQRERVTLFEQARAEAVEHFLPVNDDLKRTLQALKGVEGDELAGLVKGIQLVSDKFDEVLRKYDVERIDQTGVPFDVDLHDALMRRRVEDGQVESNTVLEVLENGYRIGDRTIRYAKVIVSE